MTLHISRLRYDTTQCAIRPPHHAQAHALIQPDGTYELICAHCGTQVYDALVSLVDHDFVCVGQRLRITSRALGAVVHLCGDDPSNMVYSEAALYLADQEVSASFT